MDNALLLSLSKQMVMRRTMDIIANNLANMNTTAFKRESALFEEYLVPVEVETATGTETGTLSFVRDYGIVRDLSTGNLQATSNPLDLAIEGEGYFTVKTPEGERYTRNGHFLRDAEGRIATTGGAILLDDSGQPIVLGPGESDIKIAEDGTISTELGLRGRIGVVTFANGQDMNKVGDSLFETTQAPEDATDASVMQGMLETSNVEPIVEMTNMVEALRSYQNSTELLSTNEDMIRRAIEKLGETSV